MRPPIFNTDGSRHVLHLFIILALIRTGEKAHILTVPEVLDAPANCVRSTSPASATYQIVRAYKSDRKM